MYLDFNGINYNAYCGMNYALESEHLHMAVLPFNQERTCVYEALYVCIMYLALYLVKLQLEQ